MRPGCLLIESHPEHPGQVRILASQRFPELLSQGRAAESGPRIRYAARFGDLDTAMMHAHTALRRRLIDIDSRRYRADPRMAVAAVDAIALAHRTLYLDPELAADGALASETARLRRRRRRTDRAWSAVGILALLFLALKLLLGI